jgi:hypothetical protein
MTRNDRIDMVLETAATHRRVGNHKMADIMEAKAQKYRA